MKTADRCEIDHLSERLEKAETAARAAQQLLRKLPDVWAMSLYGVELQRALEALQGD